MAGSIPVATYRPPRPGSAPPRRTAPSGGGGGRPRPPVRPRRWGFPLAIFGVILVLVAAAVGVVHHFGASSPTTAASATGVALDPSYFAGGACEAFAPTAGGAGRTVFLDAGHGGLDPGGVGTTESGTTITEAAETLPVELDTMARLRAAGYRVVVSRTQDSTVLALHAADRSNGALSILGSHDDVAARDVCANLAGADVLVGIYFDAASSPSESGSITTYDPSRSFASRSHRLATLVQRDVLAAMNARGWQIPDDGVMTDGGLGSSVSAPGSSLAEKAQSYDHIMLIGPAERGYFSTPSTMPGTVTEPLYLTDPFEGSIAASSTGQQVIADGIAQAIEQYFSATGSTAR